MIFAPHTLYKKQDVPIKLDALGKPIPPLEEFEWVEVCRCRCDDDTTQRLMSDNGQEYRSRYHVVYDRSDAIKEGDEIRCTEADGTLRGQGVVGMVKSTNYLMYSELWT
jgi:hypothetical protein